MTRLFAVLFAGLLAASCQDKPVTAAPSSAPVDRWVPVRAGAQSASLEVPARVVAGPSSHAVVTAPLRATVLKVRAQAGDVVDAGTPLVDVVMPEVLDAAGRAEGARARLEAWTERHAQLVSMRAEGLAKSLDVSEAAARVAEAKADGQAARAVLLAAGVRDESSAALLRGNGVVSLRAPLSGVVTQVQATLGESREPSSGPLVSLESAGATRVEARSARPLSASMQFEFVSSEGKSALTLVSAAPTADARDGAFLSWFESASPLPAGVLGRVVVHGAARDTFLVDASALQRVEGATRLVTRRGPLAVEVLRCEGADCVVTGPLESSDEAQVPR
jgi:membrane fusion protein, heavy metal efflux system